MADKADDLQRTINAANNRAKFRAKTEFPEAIVKFGRKVEQWFVEHDQPVTLHRFRGTFITLAQGKVGFAGHIAKIVPIIHTEAEFENLLRVLGYEFDDEDTRPPLTVIVCGDSALTSESRKDVAHILRQLPVGSSVVEGGQPKGVECITAELAEQLGFVCDEYGCRSMDDLVDMFDEAEPDAIIVIHENPKESKRVMAIAKLAKKADIPVKLIRHLEERPDIYEWIDEIVPVEDEDD
jgi:hypothetical protein